MKFKYALLILVTGFILSFIGALFKITHWPFANVILTFALLFQVIGAILCLYKLVTHPKFKDFMNR